jgi:peptidoglycan/LPS O-acetylase OafA/YrhL
MSGAPAAAPPENITSAVGPRWYARARVDLDDDEPFHVASAVRPPVTVPDPSTPSTRAKDRRAQLAFLDGLRGLAALYVAVGHARWLLWEGYAEGYKLHPQRYSLLGKALVFVLAAFRWGHEAVIFFFVLSGFVIHLGYATRLAEGRGARFDLWPYLKRRAKRLYPPLVVALLITFALDSLGQSRQLPTSMRATLYPLMNANIGIDHRPVTVLRNLAFIMNPVFGSDSPLWSLSYEWYFYLIYPAVYLVARRSSKAATLAMIGLSAVGNAPIWPEPLRWLCLVCQMMIVWWFGALLADRFAGRLRADYRAIAALLLAPLALAARPWGVFAHDLIFGLGFTGLLAGCFALQERGVSLAFLARLRPVGEMSYTLYVIHFPILVFMGGSLMKANHGLLPSHFGWFGAGLLFCVLVAWALHFVIERPFMSAAARNP